MPAAIAELVRPEIHRPAPSPQPGRLVEGPVHVFSKSNVARKARSTRTGRLPGDYGAYEGGDKVTVRSAQAVEKDLGKAIVVDSEVIVAGNGANLTTAFAEDPRRRHGLVLDTQLGRDADGDLIEDTLTAAGVTVIAARYDNGSTPSALDVEITTDSGAEDRVIFSGSPRELPQISKEKLPKQRPGMIYLTSIGGDNWEHTYDEVTNYAIEQDVPLAVSPGTIQVKEKKQALYNAIEASALLFVNSKEAKLIVDGAPQEKFADMPELPQDIPAEHRSQVELLLKLKRLGANLVSMTDGDNGSYLLDENGTAIHNPVLKAKNIVDRSGAGDTYAAGFLKSYMEGLSLEECMRRGALYAHAAIQVEGVPKGFLGEYSIEQRSEDTLDSMVPRVVFTKQYEPVF